MHITLALFIAADKRIRLLRKDTRDRAAARGYIAVHLYILEKRKEAKELLSRLPTLLSRKPRITRLLEYEQRGDVASERKEARRMRRDDLDITGLVTLRPELKAQ